MLELMSSWFPRAATEIPCREGMSFPHQLLILDELDPYERSPKRIASSTPWSAMFLAVSRELLLSPQSPAAPQLKSGYVPEGGNCSEETEMTAVIIRTAAAAAGTSILRCLNPDDIWAQIR